MKKLLILILSMCTLFVAFVSVGFSYTLTDSDFSALDLVEDRLFDLMEEKNLDADMVVEAIQSWMSNKKLNEKSNQLLVQLIDDIDYYWYGDEEGAVDRYMTEEDCYADEYFDADEERCYPNEEKDLDIKPSQMKEESDQEFLIDAAYILDEKDELILIEGKDDPKHSEVWNLFSSMIPVAARPDLVEVQFVDDSESDTAAYVEQTTTHHEKWKVVFNIDSYYIDGKLDQKESVYTNIHEFAHILTLQKSQAQLLSAQIDDIAYERYQSSCTTYFLQEGCLLRTSYFKAYIDAFWDQNELKQAREKDAPDVYTPQEYVTDYAATNPGEDIAESFTHFVLYEKPTGSTEAEQKRAFFYDYPELVKLRGFMRSRVQ